MFTDAKLTVKEVQAQTFALKIEDIDRIEHMIASAEARRNIALREIERHRETLGRILREAAREVEDAEFTEVEPPQLESCEEVE